MLAAMSQWLCCCCFAWRRFYRSTNGSHSFSQSDGSFRHIFTFTTPLGINLLLL